MLKVVYLVYSSVLNLYKIGVSNNTNKRIKKLQTGSPYKIEFICEYCTRIPFKIEKALHNKYRCCKRNIEEDNKLEGEWFSLHIDNVVSFIDDCKKIEDQLFYLEDAGNPFVQTK